MLAMNALVRSVGLAAALAAGPAGAIDFDDPDAAPLHFALETLSGEAVTVDRQGAVPTTYYNVQAPAGDSTLRTTTKLALSGSESYFVRVDLDGMVFSAVPKLTTSGAGDGGGLEFADPDVVLGGAGEAFVVYRLPAGQDFARELAFEVSIEDTLAVPPAAGAHRAKIALHDELGEAFDGEKALSVRAFGGEAVVAVVTSGVEIAVDALFAVADVETDFLEFIAASASGTSTDPSNPSAPAVLGSIAVGARGTAGNPPRPVVYAARTGSAVTAGDVIEAVEVRLEGDFSFATLDFRSGTETDPCQHTSPPTAAHPGGGVVPLAPPLGETTVTDTGVARLEHAEEPWGTRHLCVWLPERESGETAVRIPIAVYEATVSIEPPFGEAVVWAGSVGVIGRSGTRVDLAHLATSARYEQLLVLVNHGVARVRYFFDTFLPPAGAAVSLTQEAAAAAEAGLNVLEPGSTAVLPMAETLEIAGAGDAPFTAATLWFAANARDIGVAVVQTNRSDGSTDTVVYPALPSVRPEDVRKPPKSATDSI